MEFYLVLQKLDPMIYIYDQSYKRNLIDLCFDECRAQILICLIQKQFRFRFLRIYYPYYQCYIDPAAIKIRKYFWEVPLFRLCLNERYFCSNVFSCQ